MARNVLPTIVAVIVSGIGSSLALGAENTDVDAKAMAAHPRCRTAGARIPAIGGYRRRDSVRPSDGSCQPVRAYTGRNCHRSTCSLSENRLGVPDFPGGFDPGRGEYSPLPLPIRARMGPIGAVSSPLGRSNFPATFRMHAGVCSPASVRGNVALACVSFSPATSRRMQAAVKATTPQSGQERSRMSIT